MINTCINNKVQKFHNHKFISSKNYVNGIDYKKCKKCGIEICNLNYRDKIDWYYVALTEIEFIDDLICNNKIIKDIIE